MIHKPTFALWFLLGLLLSGLGFFLFRAYPNEKTELRRSGSNLSLGLARYLAAPIALPSARAVTGAVAGPCEKEIEEIAALDFGTFGKQDSDDFGVFTIDRFDQFFSVLAGFSRFGNCSPNTLGGDSAGKSSLLTAVSAMNAACAGLAELGFQRSLHFPSLEEQQENPSDKMVRSPLDKCVNQLNEVRQEIAEFSTRNTPIEFIRDIPTLTQKLLGVARKNPTDLKTMGLLSRRLIDLDPESSEAHGLALQVAYADWRKHPESEDRQARAAFLQDASDRLMELDPQNSFYAQYRLQFELESGNLTTVREVAERLIEEDSGMNLGNYYLAQAAYREGDHEKARDFLRRVMAGSFANQKVEASIALQIMARSPASRPRRSAFGLPNVYLSASALMVPSSSENGAPIHQLLGLTSYPIIEDDFMNHEDPIMRDFVRKAFETIAVDLSAEKIENP